MDNRFLERTKTGSVNYTNASALREYKYKREVLNRLKGLEDDMEYVKYILSSITDILEEKGLLDGEE